ncbi:MAG: hypothetical protein KatS3mg121_0253 [Gammaproteobacteria bacterium]|nr:MAG: hypothetical protein KatS3mg121_0253 [Gammaproteobacteria bacterium]
MTVALLWFFAGVSVTVLTLLVLINVPESPSPLYAGANVRFLANLPTVLWVVGVCPWPTAAGPAGAVLSAVLLGGWGFYCGWIEARRRGGVLRRALETVVVDPQGRSLGLGRALWRNAVKLALLPLAPLLLWAAMRDWRRQALHDKLAASFVMWSPERIRRASAARHEGIEVRIE